MKKILFAIVLALQSLVGVEASAAACQSATLTAYIGLGNAGCTIGNLSFTNFALLQQPTGAVGFNAINVTPVLSGNQAGLTFGVNSSAGPDQLFENLIAYRVTGIGAAVTNAQLAFAGSSSSGDGVVSVVENLCLRGLFLGADGVSGCSGTALNQILVDVGGIPDPPSSLAFASAASLAVVSDIAVDGGTDGSAALASATNLFQSIGIQVVPEPAQWLMLVTGLMVITLLRHRRRVSSSLRHRRD